LSCKRLVRRCTRDYQVHGHGRPTRGSHGRLSTGPPPPGQETRHPPHQPAPAAGLREVEGASSVPFPGHTSGLRCLCQGSGSVYAHPSAHHQDSWPLRSKLGGNAVRAQQLLRAPVLRGGGGGPCRRRGRGDHGRH
ncbi:unnamed protein product, partial [Ectocarpus fasciculatus]